MRADETERETAKEEWDSYTSLVAKSITNTSTYLGHLHTHTTTTTVCYPDTNNSGHIYSGQWVEVMTWEEAISFTMQNRQQRPEKLAMTSLSTWTCEILFECSGLTKMRDLMPHKVWDMTFSYSIEYSVLRVCLRVDSQSLSLTLVS